MVSSVDLFLLAGQFPGTDHSRALADAMSYARLAETEGFDGVWIAEHHFLSYGVCPSAPAFASYLLGATERIRVGTAVCILPARHPVALGEEAVVLDELSGGRFDLGVGRGGPWIDLQVFGTGLEAYRSGFGASLDLLCRWLSGAERVGANGPTHAFEEVAVVPRPRRPIPVWVAATSAGTAALAGERGLSLLTGMHATAEQNRVLVEAHRTAAANTSAAETGASAGTVTAAVSSPGRLPSIASAATHLAYVADTDAEAEAVLRSSMPPWLATTKEYVRIDGDGGPGRDLDAYLEHLLSIHPVGSPERCVERLRLATEVSGVDRLLLMVEGAGDADRTRENISRLAADVVPHLRHDVGRRSPPGQDSA